MRSIQKNIPLLYSINFLFFFHFYSIILVLYFAEILNSYTMAMSIITTALISASLFEIPSGIFSDKIGRKETLILTIMIRLISISLYALGGLVLHSYLIFILGAIFMGLSISLDSGNIEALIYETIRESKSEKHFPDFFGKIRSLQFLGAGTSALCAGFLSIKFDYNMIIWFSLIALTFSLFASLFVQEPKKIEKNEDHIYLHFKKSIKKIMKNKKLMKISLIKIIDKAFGDVANQFEPIYYKMLVPVWVIGLARFMKQMLGFIGCWFSGKIVNKFGAKHILYISRSLLGFFRLLALIMNSIMTPFVYAISSLFWGSNETSIQNLAQKEFSNKERATMGSIISFLGSIVFGIVSMATGVIADIASPRLAMFILVVFFISPILIYKNFGNKKKGNEK